MYPMILGISGLFVGIIVGAYLHKKGVLSHAESGKRIRMDGKWYHITKSYDQNK